MIFLFVGIAIIPIVLFVILLLIVLFDLTDYPAHLEMADSDAVYIDFELFKIIYYSIISHDKVLYLERCENYGDSIMFEIEDDSLILPYTVVYLHANIVKLGDVNLKFHLIDYFRYRSWKKKECKILYNSNKEERYAIY